MDERQEPQVRVVDRRWWARGDREDAAPDESARKPTYVEELEQRIADQTSQLQKVLAEHRRSVEDFDQAKARIRRDVAREVDRGRRALLAEMLEVLDNLDRALAAAQAPAGSDRPADAQEQLARGVELVRDQFLKKLESFEVVKLPALGQPFDAERHEAVTTTPVADEAAEGTVVAVLREGYLIGSELLRPAAVVVGTRAD
jgi:molecular chaperone GrpE